MSFFCLICIKFTTFVNIFVPCSWALWRETGWEPLIAAFALRGRIHIAPPRVTQVVVLPSRVSHRLALVTASRENKCLVSLGQASSPSPQLSSRHHISVAGKSLKKSRMYQFVLSSKVRLLKKSPHFGGVPEGSSRPHGPVPTRSNINVPHPRSLTTGDKSVGRHKLHRPATSSAKMVLMQQEECTLHQRTCTLASLALRVTGGWLLT